MGRRRGEDAAVREAAAAGAAAVPLHGLAAGAGFKRRVWWRDSLRRRLLAAADFVTAVVTGLVLVISLGSARAETLWMIGFVVLWILSAKLHGLYDRDHRALRHLTVDELPQIGLSAMTSIAVLVLGISVSSTESVRAGAALEAWVLACVVTFSLRSAARSLWRRLTPPERTLIIGNGTLAAAIARKAELFPDMHLELVHGDGDLEALTDVQRVVVASAAVDEGAIGHLLERCRVYETKLSVVPPIRAMFGTAVELDHVADLPVVQYNTWDVSRSTLLLKRSLDVAVASFALVLSIPLLLLIALAVWIDGGRPIVFSQRRAGAGGRPFRMHKFRTMVPGAEQLLDDLVKLDELSAPAFKIENDPRVTRVGRFLRRTSLDEWPQLVNVLKGEMSLVGPRPEQVELVERYGPEERFRLGVKPGLTGPMQVYGRGKLRFEERLAVEREYIENISLGRDLRILALTIASVVSGNGAY